MKILWHGVKGSLPTGYGNQTALFVPALIGAGHDVAISCVVDQYQTGLDENGILNFANGPRPWGNDLVHGHVDRYKPDAVISMVDNFLCDSEKFKKFPWYPFVFVDSEPLLPEIQESLKACKRPIAPTQHAMRMLTHAGFDPLYCPLAIDTEMYRPINRQVARADLQKMWQVDLDGKFLAVMNAANMSMPSRKNFAAAFAAWAMFHVEHPNSILYVHSEITGVLTRGEDLRKVAKLYGVENSVIFAPQYEYTCGVIGQEYLNAMYNAADVYLCTSTGEGFCLPLVEAQAAGCPVIAPNFGATAEFAHATELIKEGIKYMYHPGTERFLVDPKDAAQRLHESAAWMKADRSIADSIEETRQNVLLFDIQNVMQNHMLPMLEQIKQLEGITDEKTDEAEFSTAYA